MCQTCSETAEKFFSNDLSDEIVAVGELLTADDEGKRQYFYDDYRMLRHEYTKFVHKAFVRGYSDEGLEKKHAHYSERISQLRDRIAAYDPQQLQEKPQPKRRSAIMDQVNPKANFSLSELLVMPQANENWLATPAKPLMVTDEANAFTTQKETIPVQKVCLSRQSIIDGEIDSDQYHGKAASMYGKLGAWDWKWIDSQVPGKRTTFLTTAPLPVIADHVAEKFGEEFDWFITEIAYPIPQVPKQANKWAEDTPNDTPVQNAGEGDDISLPAVEF